MRVQFVLEVERGFVLGGGILGKEDLCWGELFWDEEFCWGVDLGGFEDDLCWKGGFGGDDLC